MKAHLMVIFGALALILAAAFTIKVAAGDVLTALTCGFAAFGFAMASLALYFDGGKR